ncbi:hypothetical protein Tco_0157421 [Tanacetum coccineum]
MNVDNSSFGTTIIEKIGKFEDLHTSGKAILMDKDGNPFKKVGFQGEYDSEDEVASVDNDMSRSMAYEKVGFGTQSLLEQWRDPYGTGDYDDDPYDDDIYEGQDLSVRIMKKTRSPLYLLKGLLTCECALLKTFDAGLAHFTVGIGKAVLTDTAAFEKFCLAVLSVLRPYFIKTAFGAKFPFG